MFDNRQPHGCVSTVSAASLRQAALRPKIGAELRAYRMFGVYRGLTGLVEFLETFQGVVAVLEVEGLDVRDVISVPEIDQ